MLLSPVITHEQHLTASSQMEHSAARRRTASDLTARVLTPVRPRGHDIPVAVLPPHDQRAHGLPRDLNNGQMSEVLTRQPLQNRACQKPG